MSDTVTLPLSLTAWTLVTPNAGAGHLTNGTEHDILYREAAVLPDATEVHGHVLHPDDVLKYALSGAQRIYARGRVMPGMVILTEGSNMMQGALTMGINHAHNGFLAPHVDTYFNALTIIDQEHSMIHQERMFTAGARTTITNAGGTLDFLGIVPPAVYPHFRSIKVALDGGPFDIDFYRAPTVSANGALVQSWNNNENSVRVAQLAVYQTPTILTLGTLLEPVLAPGGKQEGALGSDAANEWILRTNTLYLIRITNNTQGAGTSRSTINMSWYE